MNFGYADGGARLWRQKAGSTLTVWIGGIYEIKDGKTLCHVIAGGRRVCTFEPISPACAWLDRQPILHFCSVALKWPFQGGRTPYTVMLVPLIGILAVSVLSRWRERLTRCFWLPIWWRMRGRPRIRFLRALIRDLRAIRGHSPPCLACVLPHSPLLRFARSLTAITLIVSLFFVLTPTNVYAATYDPVFYYYHGDHLGSSNILTDRSGQFVDHYEYTAFGKERYNEATPAFSISNRYTGQVLDEDTGLYYYNSRYYDPELARFVQPDSIVPDPGDPQALNRYSYVLNNPLKYTDPSGYAIDIGAIIAAVIIGAVVGAAVGAGVAALTGGNIGLGALGGAIAGALTGLGIAAGGAIAAEIGADPILGAAIGGALGGAAGGAASAEVQGGDVGLGAAIGAAAGAIAGYLDPATVTTTSDIGAEGGTATFSLEPSAPPASSSAVSSAPAVAPASSVGGFHPLSTPQAAALGGGLNAFQVPVFNAVTRAGSFVQFPARGSATAPEPPHS